MKAPLCRVCDAGVGCFSCVGRIQGATQPPPLSKYFAKIDAIFSPETIVSRLNYCILSKGIGGGYHKRAAYFDDSGIDFL